MQQIKGIILWCSLCLCSTAVMAESLRCKQKLVRPGDTTVEVKLKCGEPFAIEDTGKVKIKNMFVDIVRFTYLQEKGSFAKILEFKNGKLVSITHGPRI